MDFKIKVLYSPSINRTSELVKLNVAVYLVGVVISLSNRGHDMRALAHSGFIGTVHPASL